MIVLQAIWTNGALHLWGEEAAEGGASATRGDPGALDYAVGVDTLLPIVGDAYDALLASAGVASELTLRLPARGGRPLRSTDLPAALGSYSLEPVRLPTLRFSAADAVDLLTARSRGRDCTTASMADGSSLRYWGKLAGLVRELLARQRFVPALHQEMDGSCRGYWRVVLDDQETSYRLGQLIASMPLVCRAIVADGDAVQASALVENFLWTTVDALVRRCLEGDELAHAVQEQPRGTASSQMRWLRSLVSSDPRLSGPAEDLVRTSRMVSEWIGKLEPGVPGRAFRTCFRLHPPPVTDSGSVPRWESGWRLTVHLQATEDPEMVVDAAALRNGDPGRDPRILRRPFQNAAAELAADITAAAKHFPALAALNATHSPMELTLALAEAYAFLRDAAPMLEHEGFGVWLPTWWREDRPRLRMWLHVRPATGSTPVGRSTMGFDSLVSYDWRLALGDEDLTSEEMNQLASSAAPLVRLHGRWTEVQTAELEAAVRFLREGRGGTITLFEALRRCYAADDLATGLPVGGLRASGWIEHLLHADIHEAIDHLDEPKGFQGKLRPYQLRGLEWLSFLSRLGLGGCLADDMGLGKTIQLIALWLHERLSGDSPGPTLLVVPMSLVGNWHREIGRFAPSLRVLVHHGGERLTGREFVDQVAGHDVVVSTYGLIHRDFEHLGAVSWYRVALDEAQNIKNAAAKQAQAIRALRSLHRVALTGTPIENRLSELWSIIDFLNPDYLGAATEFRRRFAVPIERYHDTDRAQRLRHLIRPFVLRRLKSDPKIEVDLPEKMETKIYCNLTREQAALYQAVVDEMLLRIEQSVGMQRRGLILAALVKLKQVCNHPAQYLADASTLPHRSGKADRLTDMLDEVLAEGDRAIIFTQFREMGKLLQRLISEVFQSEALFLHGGSSRLQRDAMVEEFQRADGGSPLMILSLKAGGYGLNLTAANHVFHFDRWWNPAVEDQATDRAHRIGQERRVQVHKFVCIGTLEERIDALLEQKRNLADNIVGSGEDWLTELSTDKLREMFQLSREAVAED